MQKVQLSGFTGTNPGKKLHNIQIFTFKNLIRRKGAGPQHTGNRRAVNTGKVHSRARGNTIKKLKWLEHIEEVSCNMARAIWYLGNSNLRQKAIGTIL